MANEEIVGGLISALSRGESLEKAMMSFYNAGYKKEEIEDSAKTVYIQLGPQAMGIKGSLQDTLKTIASKVGLVKKNPEAAPAQNITEKPFQEKLSYKEEVPQNKAKLPQKVSSHGEDNYQRSNYPKNNYEGTYHNVDQVTDKIVRAIKDLKQVNFPSRIEIVSKNEGSRSPAVVQKVSDYSGVPPKSVNKVVTYILVFLLILLLGILAAVFFFKDNLIKLFNNFGLG